VGKGAQEGREGKEREERGEGEDGRGLAPFPKS